MICLMIRFVFKSFGTFCLWTLSIIDVLHEKKEFNPRELNVSILKCCLGRRNSIVLKWFSQTNFESFFSLTTYIFDFPSRSQFFRILSVKYSKVVDIRVEERRDWKKSKVFVLRWINLLFPPQWDSTPKKHFFMTSNFKDNSISNTENSTLIFPSHSNPEKESFVQLVFVIDTTASQKPHHETIQKTMNSFLRFLYIRLDSPSFICYFFKWFQDFTTFVPI
jgi:hypothetical protein